MKIILITKHYVKNYGSVLQTYASQELLSRKGGSVYVANYILPEASGLKYMDIILRKHTSGSRLKKMILRAVVLPTMIRWKYVFGGFLKQYLNVCGSPADNCEKLRAELADADIYCTGSDQVWNPETNRGLQPAYFCEFAPKGKKIVSLAASFGVKTVREEDKELIKKYLEKYSLLSVRESSGIDILAEAGMKGRMVLDPVMIETAGFWKKLAAKRKIRSEYVLVYQLNRSRAFDRYAEQAAERLGKKLVRICTRYDQILKNGRAVPVPTVEQWISLFYYADLVITDSFHGTVFSILFQKEFINLYPPLFSERLDSLLSMFGIEERHISDCSRFDILDKRIDYTKVNEILDEKRKESLEFIDEILAG